MENLEALRRIYEELKDLATKSIMEKDENWFIYEKARLNLLDYLIKIDCELHRINE